MKFIAEDHGAVTVDWVVLTAALVGLGLATLAVVDDGVQDLSTDIDAELKRGDIIKTSFAKAATWFSSGDPYFNAETAVEANCAAMIENRAAMDTLFGPSGMSNDVWCAMYPNAYQTTDKDTTLANIASRAAMEATNKGFYDQYAGWDASDKSIDTLVGMVSGNTDEATLRHTLRADGQYGGDVDLYVKYQRSSHALTLSELYLSQEHADANGWAY